MGSATSSSAGLQGSEYGLLSIWMKTKSRPEKRETKPGGKFEEFQDIVKSRTGAKKRVVKSLEQAGNLCGMWMDPAPPGTILQGGLRLFIYLEQRKHQEL